MGGMTLFSGGNLANTRVIFGERVSKEGKLRLGCSAAIFDNHREKLLLTRRTDNGQWCLPGGAVEAGESVSEACAREVWEETGLRVRIKRLVGVYSDPNKLVIYPDGHKAQIVALSFEAEIVSGEPGLSNETTEWGYFNLEEIARMEMLGGHLDRVRDIFTGQVAAFIK
jgi:ADP-ribose pyrophosphatase YjhB (NUDIX family)